MVRLSDAAREAQGVLAGIDLAPSGDDLRPYEADFTPAALAVQQCLELRELGLRPRRILDPSAGSGVVARAAQAVWPEARVVVGELREEEEPWLKRHFEDVYLGDTTDENFEAWAREVADGDHYDLVITNPPFSYWRRYVLQGLDLLSSCPGCVCLLGLDAWGQRGKADSDFFERFPPVAQHRVTGSVSFRANGSVDMRDYSWWSFSSESVQRGARDEVLSRPTWTCANLPRLPSHLRRWRNTRPGREDHAVYASLLREIR